MRHLVDGDGDVNELHGCIMHSVGFEVTSKLHALGPRAQLVESPALDLADALARQRQLATHLSRWSR